MDNTTFGILFMGFILLIIVAVVGITITLQQKNARAWKDLAARLGLEVGPVKFFFMPTVSGSYRAHELRLDTFTRGSGKNSTTYTRVMLALANPGGMQLELSGENVFSKIGKALGGQDIETGDAELDGRYVIKGQPESAVLRILMQINLRQRRLEVKGLHVKVNGDTLYYERRGIESNPETLRALIDLLVDIADGVERI